MSRLKQGLGVFVLLASSLGLSLAASAQPGEIDWPKTPFAQGLHLPSFGNEADRKPVAGCGSSSCTSPADPVCGQCSIACPLGKASVCYPGVRTDESKTDSRAKESCAQRPACSCN